jgi:hypothetical protein
MSFLPLMWNSAATIRNSDAYVGHCKILRNLQAVRRMLKNADVCRCPGAGQLWSCACKKAHCRPNRNSRCFATGPKNQGNSGSVKAAAKNSQWDCLFPNGPTLWQCSSSVTAFAQDLGDPPTGPNCSYLLETAARLLDRRRLSRAAVVVFVGRRDNEIHFACNKPRPHIRLICRDSG